jgi:hypothetical protein
MSDLNPKSMSSSLPESHRRLVEKLVADNKPTKPVPSVLQQWMIWLGFALLVVAFSLYLIGPQFEIMERLTEPSSGGFLLLAFVLSALAAWVGIASSMPDHRSHPAPRVITAFFVLFLFSMPILFFDRDTFSQVWANNMEDGWFCVRTVVLVAFPSWVILGWMASRNASFHPGWTGAWLGVSAFLLGTGTIQLHCAHWETCHMLVDHLLPMLVLIFLPIWIGGYWFSRWRK